MTRVSFLVKNAWRDALVAIQSHSGAALFPALGGSHSRFSAPLFSPQQLPQPFARLVQLRF